MLLFVSIIVCCVKYTYPSELTNPQIPTIEVIQPFEPTSSGTLYLPIKNNAPVEDAWKTHLFTIAIEKNICSSVVTYAVHNTERHIAINIGQGIATFKNAIDANKDIYFKNCAFLYEVLFPSRNQSPIKNINNNGSPRSISPRRASGSGQSFYNKFSVDPSIQEPTKEYVLKNEEQKNLFTNIIAYCILNLNPQILSELCEKIIQSNQVNRIERKNTNDEYVLLQKKYTALETDYNKNLLHINQLQSTIKKLEAAAETIDQGSEAPNNMINNLDETIEKLKKELENAFEQNNLYADEVKQIENIKKELQNINQQNKELMQSNDRLSMYRLISVLSFSTTIILLICLLYKNDHLSNYYANMLH